MGFESKKIIEKMDATIPDPAAVAEMAPEYTLKSILADKKRSVLFGELLSQSKKGRRPIGEDIAKNLLTNPDKLSSEDLSLVEEVHVDFVKRLESVKQLKESLTLDVVKEVITRSSELTKQVNLVGVEDLRNVLLDQMESLAVQEDQDHFNQIKGAIEDLAARESEIKQNDQRISEYAEKNNINVADLENAFMESDYMTRRENVKQAINDGLKWYQFSWFKTDQKIQELEQERHIIGGSSNDLNVALHDVAKSLAMTLSKNEDVRAALVENATGRKNKVEDAGLSFKDAGKDFGSEDSLQKELEEFKKKNIKLLSETDDAYKARIQPLFEKSVLDKKVGGKTGLWFKIKKSFMSGLIGKLKYS